MASYPCESCGTRIEITGLDYDVRCKKCGEKKPFKCTKCQKRIGMSSIYHPERLNRAGKPIFCEDCGSESDYVNCAQCKTSVMRSNTVEKTIDGVSHFYHKQCYDDAVAMQKRIFPIAIIGFTLIFAYPISQFILHNYLLSILPGAILGFFGAKKVASMFAPK